MSTIQDTDLFPLRQGGTTYKATAAQLKAGTTGDVVVRRGTTNYRLSAAALATVGDADILPVGRGGQPYWVSGADLKAYLTPLEPELVPWTPEVIAGKLAVWMDASDSSTVTVVDGRATGWTCKATGISHTAVNVINQPSYNTTDLKNGLNTIRPIKNADRLVSSVEHLASTTGIVYSYRVPNNAGNPAQPDPWELTTLLGSATGNNTWMGGQRDTLNMFWILGSLHASSDEFIRVNGSAPVRAANIQRAAAGVYAQMLIERSNSVVGSVTLGILGTDSIGNPGAADRRGWTGDYCEIVGAGTNTPLTADEMLQLEGYLAHRWWGTTNNLPAGHPYKDEPPMRLRRAWTPADLPGVYSWHEAWDPLTVTVDGNQRVTQWDDKSGAGRHYTQANSGNQFVYDSVNRVMNLDAEGRRMDMLNDVLNQSTSITVCGVVNPRVLTDTNTWLRKGVTPWNMPSFYVADSSIVWWDGTTMQGITSPATLPMLVLFRWGANGGIAHVNGVSSGPDSTSPIPFSPRSTTTPRNTGSWTTVSSSTDFVGTIACIVESIYAVSDADRERLEGYVAHGAGQAALLPANHPYKNSPPVL